MRTLTRTKPVPLAPAPVEVAWRRRALFSNHAPQGIAMRTLTHAKPMPLALAPVEVAWRRRGALLASALQLYRRVTAVRSWRGETTPYIAENPSPSPGTPGEGGGEGLSCSRSANQQLRRIALTLTLSWSTGRGDQKCIPSEQLQ
jgi:hypothetical protein